MITSGQRLIQAANEALAFAEGTADAASFRVHLPPTFDVKGLRNRLGLTQAGFSARFGFNIARLRDWEQGRSAPDSAVRAYLTVIARETAAVERALVAA